MINVRLATLDENGNCTNGITRHYTPNTNWTVNFSNYLYTWDRTKYLNIYVVKTMQNGAAGYTYLPGQVSPNIDDIVIIQNYLLIMMVYILKFIMKMISIIRF